jgi:NADH-quinone oxidoreductase subunit J
MTHLFYIAALVAVIATVLAITRHHAVHALLYLIVSLLAVALVFFTLGAPFVAALEVIIYAGAILVLFLFVMMMLNLGEDAKEQEREWQPLGIWIGPALLSCILLALIIQAIIGEGSASVVTEEVGPKAVGSLLFGPYMIAAELGAFLLMAGVVGASHLRRREFQSEITGKEES